MQINKNAQIGTSPNTKSQPDDIRLVRQVEAVRIQPNQTEQFGGGVKQRNQSSDANDFQHATRTSGEIDKDVVVKSVVSCSADECGMALIRDV